MEYVLIVIGTSLGGLAALKVLLGGLPKNFSAAIAVVQHRHKTSDHLLGDCLQPYIKLPIQEVEDKDKILPGIVYLAPVDYHLLVEKGYFSLSVDDPVCFSRPSIDVLFESAADSYAQQVIGVILTGANHDGAEGLAKIKTCGGVAIVQNPATAESNIMPLAAIAMTKVDAILPIEAIAPLLVNLCSSVRR